MLIYVFVNSVLIVTTVIFWYKRYQPNQSCTFLYRKSPGSFSERKAKSQPDGGAGSKMAANVGLRYVLTICGMVDLVVPFLFKRRVDTTKLLLGGYYTSLLLRIRFTKSRGGFLLRRLKHGIINSIRPPISPFLELPYEVREQIYKEMCQVDHEGKATGILSLLLINKQIHEEAKPVFDQVPHTIHIGDLEKHKSGTIEYMGLPYLITINESLDWHLSSLKHLILVVSICGISTMTPDCFDVLIAHNGKEQWRNLKRLIGIWPELRTDPLTTIRLDLQPSTYNPSHKTYRADFIRVIRNFKRTRVWAETLDGDCTHHTSKSAQKNASKILPLVRAFNQGRRNWVTESSVDNNLIVRYDKHILSLSTPKPVSATNEPMDLAEFLASEKAQDQYEKEKRRWSVIPTDDTTRSDNSVWPEWTGKEEKYIHEKMVLRQRDCDEEYECKECLAVFDRPGELKEHLRRGRERLPVLKSEKVV